MANFVNLKSGIFTVNRYENGEISISSAGVFAEAMKTHGLCGATIVAPDEGAIARCEAVKMAAGMPPGEIPYFEKHLPTWSEIPADSSLTWIPDRCLE